MKRRTFVTTGLAVGTAALAGCSSGNGTDSAGTTDSGGTTDGGDGGDGGDATATDTTESADNDAPGGRFRLLISDRPAAIGDFDSLTVSFSHARVFGEAASTETATSATETATTENTTATTENTTATTENATENGGGAVQPDDEDEDDSGNGNGRGNGNGDDEKEAEDEEETEDEEREEETEDEEREDEAEDDGGDAGFTTFDLSGESVDLTQVVGNKAMSVLDETLAPGRYTKIELHAADVTGIVDGEEANVKIPSGKLMLTKPFEVVAGESVSFVFDINVVQRGKGNDYNLLPVIGESGVAGKDVEVDEVDEDAAGTTATGENATEDTTDTATQNGTETTVENVTTENTTTATTDD